MPSLKKLFWKNWIVLLLGLVLVLMPFLGFPSNMARSINGALGVVIAVLAFSVGRGLSMAYSEPATPAQAYASKQSGLPDSQPRRPRVKKSKDFSKTRQEEASMAAPEEPEGSIARPQSDQTVHLSDGFFNEKTQP